MGQPGKRPMSSMSPMIVLDSSGQVRQIAGAAGGSRIITAVSQTLIRSLLLGQRVDDAVGKPRLHHQLMPNVLYYEDGIPQDILHYLRSKGHKLESQDHRDFGIANSIQNKCGSHDKDACIEASADWRVDKEKITQPAGY